MNKHIVTIDGEIFAVEINAQDCVMHALAVVEPISYQLDAEVDQAKLSYDFDQARLCEVLTGMLQYGEATTIGAYFEVSV